MFAALRGNTLKYTEELMICSWVLPASKATSYHLEKANAPLRVVKLETCAPFGTSAAPWTQSQASIPRAVLWPLQFPSAGAFAAQECTPMVTAVTSVTGSGNIALVDQLGSRSAELSQPQRIPLQGTPWLHSNPMRLVPIEPNVTIAGSVPSCALT